MHEERDGISVPSEDAPWFPDVNEFALTFNAYQRVGDFGTVAEMANTAESVFFEHGGISENLETLRSCLFFEQRRYRHSDSDPYRTPKSRSYLKALLGKIRELSGGAVPGPADPLP